MNIIVREQDAFSAWQVVVVSDQYTLEYMARALRASPGSEDWNLDCGFTSEIAGQMDKRHGQELELWESDLISYEHDVLVMEVVYSFYPDRGPVKRVVYRIMDNSLD